MGELDLLAFIVSEWASRKSNNAYTKKHHIGKEEKNHNARGLSQRAEHEKALMGDVTGHAKKCAEFCKD